MEGKSSLLSLPGYGDLVALEVEDFSPRNGGDLSIWITTDFFWGTQGKVNLNLSWSANTRKWIVKLDQENELTPIDWITIGVSTRAEVVPTGINWLRLWSGDELVSEIGYEELNELAAR